LFSPSSADAACEPLPTELSAVVAASLRLTFMFDPIALLMRLIKFIELVILLPPIIIISPGFIIMPALLSPII
jgi:hypothetical protein